MRAIYGRLRTLEDRCGLQQPRNQMRLVFCAIGRPLDLANSTCRLKLDSAGNLIEIVELMGSRAELTDDQLESFVQSFPVDAGMVGFFIGGCVFLIQVKERE